MLFSVITVTYNAENYLERTIQSVLSQSASDQIEYIIIDGASTDKTLEIINEYGSKIDLWLSEPDEGLYDAMNKGLRVAKGEYVWFMNAGDEMYDKNTVQDLISLLDTFNHQKNCLPDIIYGETQLIDSQGDSVGPRRLKAPTHLSWKDFRWGMLVSHQSFIVKRSIAPLFDTHWRYVADFEWCIKCLKESGAIMNSHIILSNYMEEGLSTVNRKASLKERYQVMSTFYGTIPVSLLHIWFAIRFYFSKVIKGRV